MLIKRITEEQREETKRRRSMRLKAYDQARIQRLIDAKIAERNAIDAKIKAAWDFQANLLVGQLATRVIDRVNRRFREDAKKLHKGNHLRLGAKKLAKVIGMTEVGLRNYLKFNTPMPIPVMDAIMYAMNISVLDLLLPEEIATVYDVNFTRQERWATRKAREVAENKLQIVLDSEDGLGVTSILPLPNGIRELKDSQLDSGGES